MMRGLICDGLFAKRKLVPTRDMLQEVLKYVKVYARKVMVVGGKYGSNNCHCKCEVYSCMTGKWDTLDAQYPLAISNHKIVALKDGSILSIGGFCNSITLGLCFLYTSKTKLWKEVNALFIDRLDHSAVTLDEGRVMVAGGVAYGSQMYTVFDTIEFFDPVQQKWTLSKTKLPHSLTGHCAVLLGDGTVLFIGGMMNDGTSRSTKACFTYDPATDSFADVAPMNMVRIHHAAVVVPDGRVLVTGGLWAPSFDDAEDMVNAGVTCEIYDHGRNEWVMGPKMHIRRANHQCIITATGVMCFGGERDNPYDCEVMSFDMREWVPKEFFIPALAVDSSASCSFF